MILAKALRDLGSIPEALAAYERERRTRVEKHRVDWRRPLRTVVEA